MGKSLSPRDAADRLGITTDTLRRWDREGRIEAQRTPGGQRRYREADVNALLEFPRGPISVRSVRPQKRALLNGDLDTDTRIADSDSAPVTAGNDIAPWERRVAEERADLEVTKIQREREALLREDRESEEIRITAERQAREASAREIKRETERVSAARAEQERLEGLRAQGRGMCLFAPIEYQARVTRDLESFVSPHQFPATLNFYTAYQILKARVDRVLKPWTDHEARQKAARDDERERTHKIALGVLYGNSHTFGWDLTDARGARGEIKDALEAEVTSEWAEGDVHELVDEVLEEWDDE
jgi:excisionase family DNA binding protein